MRTVPLSSITIPDNRQRREFDPSAITELAESIRLRGLFHPIVVSPLPGNLYQLIAGERRFRAISQLADLDTPFRCGSEEIPPGFIPITLLSELDPLTLKEIELEENVMRVDLTWQELVRARAELDALRRQQNPLHTTADTAREVFGQAGGARNMAIREAVLLSRHLSDPDIASAASQREAMRILERKKLTESRMEKASLLPASSSSLILFEGDFHAHIHSIPDQSCSAILTDPPYGIEADRFGDQAALRHLYPDSPESTLQLLSALAGESFRIAAPQAHAYCFCSPELFPQVSDLWRAAGWEVWPRPLIWYKGNLGFLPRPEHGPRYTYESIIFAIKGGKKIVKPGHDVIVNHQSTATNRLHAAQKPVGLFVELLSRSVLPGDTVADPFAGSGTIFRAARELHLRAFGIERDPEQIANCKLAIQGE